MAGVFFSGVAFHIPYRLVAPIQRVDSAEANLDRVDPRMAIWFIALAPVGFDVRECLGSVSRQWLSSPITMPGLLLLRWLPSSKGGSY